ncbi:sulfatase family protein [Pararhizobium mangrovi]|uniref:DUF229 domain-containing protein n=1 Tax=Pararhizobium mangrovi TaxID=2590452 RepID=A0A506UE51_9HYPH|nr:sulfatase-like hydrolase/transferase [Pararhizobium mangrovi]TPW31888.1 DUF229 domain-containing protein [Pararhizobium mangrovi]
MSKIRRTTAPNVVWIFCDQLRTDALSCYRKRCEDIHTPNIDAIAERGTLFEQFFVNSPICTPSRTCFLTGLYPEQSGVYHNEGFSRELRFPESAVTVPETFAAAGYVTANFGKSHVPAPLSPWQMNDTAGGLVSDPRASGAVDGATIIRSAANDHIIAGIHADDVFFEPERVAQNVEKFLDEAEGPFFVRASILQPHTPIVVPEKYAGRYDAEASPGKIVRHPNLSRFETKFAETVRDDRLSEHDFRLAQALYYDLVSWIDDQVGRIMQALRRNGLLDDTIVLFGSDHGAYVGEEGVLDMKHTFAPQVHRVPFIVSGPGVPRDHRRSDIAESVDFAPSLCALAGLDADPQYRGRDLFSDPEPEYVYGTVGYGAEGSFMQPIYGAGMFDDTHGWPRRACIRTKRFRLDMNVRIDGHVPDAAYEDIFLADVENDPEETENIASVPEFADTVMRLKGELKNHIRNSVEPDLSAVYAGFQYGDPPGV